MLEMVRFCLQNRDEKNSAEFFRIQVENSSLVASVLSASQNKFLKGFSMLSFPRFI